MIRLFAAFLLVLSMAACDTGSSEPLVARAGTYDFTVDEAVRLLAGQSQVPNQPQVVQALANLWIDYTLLADAASRDSTLAQVDFDELVRQQLEAEMIMTLRDSAVQVDTSFTDQELEALFREQAPGVQIRARHILLSYPSQATQEQRDSVRARLEDLRARIESGESFEALAREHSVDRASAEAGGDLGFFGRGEMVEPFDEAAFALEPGEMSDIVETPYGLHLIRVEEKQVPTFAERQADFRQQMVQRRMAQADSTFVTEIEANAAITPVENAADLTRQIASNPDVRLRGRASRRPVVEYEGGALTLAELRTFMQTRPPQFLQQVAMAPDEVLEEQVLTSLAQRELLVEAARERGYEPAEARRDSLTGVARTNFAEVARQMGFATLRTQEGETREQAVERVVNDLLRDIVQGRQSPIPLGPVSWTLRQQYETEVLQGGLEQVVAEVEEIRGPQQAPGGGPQRPVPGPQQGQPQVPTGSGGVTPPATADTTGNG